MTFLNADGTMKHYYVEPNDKENHHWAKGNAVIRNMDKKIVGSVDLTLTSSATNETSVAETLGDAAEELSEMDRVAIYWRCQKELYDVCYYSPDTE